MSNFLEPIPFTSASDFLDYLQPRKPHWLPSNSMSSPWVFRGQSNSEWRLEPSALRKDVDWFTSFKSEHYAKVAEHVKQAPNIYRNDGATIPKERIVDVILQVAAEYSAVDEFVDLADEVGHLIPTDEQAFWGGDEKPFWEEVADAFAPLKSLSKIDYDGFAPRMIKFALAQHHGIPTRLIDWTHSPFIAAFFAIEEVKIKKIKSERISIWAINYTNLSDTDLEIVTHRKQKISYLSAQSGLFIYDTKVNLEFIRQGFWRSIEQALETNRPMTNAILRKITLDSSEANELLRLLSAEGVTRAQIMPTFDNVTETLKLQHKLFK